MEEIFELNRVVGSYRVIRVLGSGGMGVVYEAEHLELKVRRALKVFAVGGEHAALHRKRFLSEGKMLAALDHARVVRVHEFDVDAVSGRPYFVMDDSTSRSRCRRTTRPSGASVRPTTLRPSSWEPRPRRQVRRRTRGRSV